MSDHSRTCDLVGYRQGYNAPPICSCGAGEKETDGNQATTQSSGVNRGSAALKSSPSSSSLTVELARHLRQRVIDILSLRGVDEGLATRQVDALIAAVHAEDAETITQLQAELEKASRAGLIHQPIPDVAGTEPHLTIPMTAEELDWVTHAARLRCLPVDEYVRRAINISLQQEGVDAVLLEENDDETCTDGYCSECGAIALNGADYCEDHIPPPPPQVDSASVTADSGIVRPMSPAQESHSPDDKDFLIEGLRQRVRDVEDQLVTQVVTGAVTLSSATAAKLMALLQLWADDDATDQALVETWRTVLQPEGTHKDAP